MPKSAYVLQVAEKGSGKVVASWPPGLEQERDLIAAIVSRVRARGVGVFRTEARVLEAVRDAIEQGVMDLKLQVKP